MTEFAHELPQEQFAPIEATRSPMWRTWVSMLLLAMVVYLPAALGAELLMFDDIYFFGPDNPEFQAGFWTVLTEPIANAYLPVAHVSLWLDYTLGSGESWLPHLHALVLHAVAGMVLTRLLLQLGVGALAAHVAAAIFVVHPALCESVAWVSSRKSLLSGLFVFLALFQTVRFAHKPSAVRAVLLALLAAAAMLSNATSVVLPLLSIGVVLWRRGPRQRWLAPAVLFAVTVPIALYHTQLAAAQGTLAGGDQMTRLQQMPGAFWHYLTTAVWPTQLNLLYPEVDTLARFREQLLPGSIALGAFVVVGVVAWLWRATRPFAAGLLGFVVALLPFNTAFPASSIAAADRYLYLAIPGIALAAVSAFALAHRRAPMIAALLVAPLLWLGGSRAHDFGSETEVWQASLAVEDDNAVAHYNLAVATWNTAVLGRRELPVEEYEQHLNAAIRSARYPIHELRARRKLLPIQMMRADYEKGAANAQSAIAAARAQLARESSEQRRSMASRDLLQAQLAAFEPLNLNGNGAAADEVLAEAKAAAPDSPDVIAFEAVRQLAALQPELLALAQKGQEPRLADDDARGKAVDERLGAVREQHPEHAGVWLAQALWHQARDQVTAALRCYRKATELRPDEVTAWLSAARMMRERKFYDSALEYAHGGWQHRRDPQLLQEIALALVGLNKLKEAEKYLSAYMQLEPDDKDSGRILSNLLIGHAYTLLSDRSKREAVRKLVDDALRYNPDEPRAFVVLGRLAHEERRYALAVRYLERAHKALPNFADAREQLAHSLAALGDGRFINKDDMKATEAWLRCIEVAPQGFELDSVKRQLKLAWSRIEKLGAERKAGLDLDGAVACFRRCLQIDPEQHWASWLLATTLHSQFEVDAGKVDLDELVALCKQAIAWQQTHALDSSRQVYLLALTLIRKGEIGAARLAAADYLAKPSDEVEPQVRAALEQVAGK